MAQRHGSQRRRTYGRRSGHRLSSRQSGLVENLLPALRVDLGNAPFSPPARMFGVATKAVWLEIGFGGGEHLFEQARAHPCRGLIGCEPFVNGVAKLLSLIDRAGLDNVRIHDGDARDLLETLPDAYLERVFLLYPDPWPKARHHKRRFICRENLDQLARVMTPGAELRFATDVDSYARWTLAHIRHHAAFDWSATCAADWRVRPGDWPATRYEIKALDAGRIPFYLSFRRMP